MLVLDSINLNRFGFPSGRRVNDYLALVIVKHLLTWMVVNEGFLIRISASFYQSSNVFIQVLGQLFQLLSLHLRYTWIGSRSFVFFEELRVGLPLSRFFLCDSFFLVPFCAANLPWRLRLFISAHDSNSRIDFSTLFDTLRTIALLEISDHFLHLLHKVVMLDACFSCLSHSQKLLVQYMVDHIPKRAHFLFPHHGWRVFVGLYG